MKYCIFTNYYSSFQHKYCKKLWRYSQKDKWGNMKYLLTRDEWVDYQATIPPSPNCPSF